MFDLDKLRGSPASRRNFVAAVTAAGVGLAATRLLANGLTTPAPVTPIDGPTGVPTDAATQFAGIPGRNVNEQILNFALTLEILEADLYRQALNLASGRPLTQPLDASAGGYQLKVGGSGFNARQLATGFEYLVEFTFVEAAHREFVRAALNALGAPTVKRNPGGYKFPQTLPPDLKVILATGILPLEETGVRAYLGALPYFTDLNLAQTAGTIFSTEARHSAVISANVGIDAGPRKMPGDLRVSPKQPSENTLEYFLKPQTVLTRASQYFA